MKYISLQLLLYIILTIQVASAQNGSIIGVVKDKNTKEPLIGVTVSIEGTTKGTITDFDGQYRIEGLVTGAYNIKVSYISYQPIVFEGIKVENNKFSQLNIDLEETTLDITEVTITATRIKNTDIALLNSIKTSNVVVSGISAQQIQKSQDRDASEVVKRIPGISIIDDRFIVVRGLSQRYNSVWLNDVATPSSEADVKAFSFDVIPSSMIDNLMIYKTTAPEIPADFAGGFIKIYTKDMPDKNSYYINFSGSINQGTTFNDFYKYQGGKYDWLGFDDGTRKYPEEYSHLETYENSANKTDKMIPYEVGKKLNNNWTASEKNALPDLRFLIGANQKLNIGRVLIGNSTAINYSNTYDYNNVMNNNYSIYKFAIDTPSFNEEFQDQQFTNTAKLGILHNWSVFLGKGQKIEFRNMFNQIGWTRTSFRNGREWYNDGRYIKSYEYRFSSRTTYSGQLGGEHSFFNGNSKLDWNYGYSKAIKDEPDLKRFRLLRDEEGDTTKYLLLFNPSQPDLASESRMFLKLQETIKSISANYTQKIKINNFTPEIKFGYYDESKDREFNAKNLGYSLGEGLIKKYPYGYISIPQDSIFNTIDTILTDENNDTSGIKLKEITSKSDSYTAANDQTAIYLALKIPFTKKINLYTGVRFERNRQQLLSYKQGQSGKSGKVYVDNDTFHLFPSANLSYNLTEKMLVRFAYGLSINRPEFREIAPFYFVDFDLNAGIYGNPALKECLINNYDFRYEIYPSSNEMISLGGFYKQFTNPIEMVYYGNNPTQFTFQNVEGANNFGAEVELRKSMDFIKIIKNITLVFNSSYIYSKVKFNDTTLFTDRPMQGQSPYIINTGIFYQQEKNGLMISALYNVIGPRIMAVGRPSPNLWESIPDVYEMPRHSIDLTFSKKIGKYFELKGGIKDLLNQKVILLQKINTDVPPKVWSPLDKSSTQYYKHFDRKQITKSYNPGRYFNLGISMKF